MLYEDVQLEPSGWWLIGPTSSSPQCTRKEAEEETGYRIGGLVDVGEDIEVVEMPLAESLTGISTGLIQDAKTVMLLQHVALSQLVLVR